MSKDVIGKLKAALRRHPKFNQDPIFYDAKAECRDIVRAAGDPHPLIMIHGPRTVLYFHDGECLNVAA